MTKFKVGDKVRYVGPNRYSFKGKVGEVIKVGQDYVDVAIDRYDLSLPWYVDTSEEWEWEIVESRPKKWGEMTPEEKGVLLLAHHECKPIQVSSCGAKYFTLKPSWHDDQYYRVKPEPDVMEESVYDLSGDYKITYNVVDGEVDCDSVKMEKL